MLSPVRGRSNYQWLREHPDTDVRYLTQERARQLVARGAERGRLQRIGRWETSPALEWALLLEAEAPPG